MCVKRQLLLAIVLLSLGLAVAAHGSLFTLISQRQASVSALAAPYNSSPGADISVAQQISPNPMQSGAVATYTLQITNASMLTLPAVVTDTLSADMVFVEEKIVIQFPVCWPCKVFHLRTNLLRLRHTSELLYRSQ